MLGPLVVESANCLPFIGSSEFCDSVQSLQALAFLHALTNTSPLGPFSTSPNPLSSYQDRGTCMFDSPITKLNFSVLKTIYVVYKDFCPFKTISIHQAALQ